GFTTVIAPLADNAVENIVTFPVCAIGITEVEVIKSPARIGYHNRISPNAQRALHFRNIPGTAAVGRPVHIVQHTAYHHLIGVGRVDGNARLARTYAFTNRRLVDQYGLSATGCGGDTKRKK